MSGLGIPSGNLWMHALQEEKMPFEIVRNDIVNMQVDAIVNTANPRPIVGAGVDSAIHKKAGESLLEARKKIGDIEVGDAKITEAFALRADYVIHTVGPVWQGGVQDEKRKLQACYQNALKLAVEYQCESVAFPLISSGAYGFPKDLALEIAISTISSFLLNHEMMVYLVVFDKTSFALSEKLFKAVASYIDENYVQQNFAVKARQREQRRQQRSELLQTESMSLKELLGQVDDTFSEAVFRWIMKKDLTDPQVYKKANLDRKLFSKIRNNMDYRPSKITAVAVAIGLELTLEETKELIAKAGYALTHSSKFDIIVEYFIVQGNYNVFEMNEVLFAFDQPLIGN